MQLSHIEQSEAWGKFQEKVPGRGKYWLLNFANSKGGVDSALIIRQKLPKGMCWFWCPRGPILEDYQDETAWQNFLKEVNSIATQEKAIFLRVEAPLLKNESIKWPKTFKKAHNHYLPEHSLIIDLEQSEEEILSQMKPKGRYNIKLAAKKGVTVEMFEDPNKGAEIFQQLMQTTTERDKFHGHNKQFYQDMLSLSEAKLFIAKYKNKILAALIATFYKDTATYYFGASSNEHRNLMAPYLLQWEAMKYAKSQGCKHYDLLGIAPENASASHPWQGITAFKRKFGGTEVIYHEAKEYIINSLWFKAMKAYKTIRKII